MNSLKFIDKEIEWTESALSGIEDILNDKVYCYFNKESVLDKLNETKKRLKKLQQIKTELEAWEICKNDTVISSILKDFVDGKSINYHRLPEEKRNKLKKALEVKNV